MLLQFKVENFRSIGEAQTLDLIASSAYKELIDRNTLDLHAEEKLPRILKTAAVYGPNAAGKTSLVMALAFLRWFVADSLTQTQAGTAIPVVPFRLSPSFREKDSSFEVVFFEEEWKEPAEKTEETLRSIRYQYGFRLNQKRVTEEWLLAYPHGRPQKWFHRVFDPGSQSYRYTFGSHFLGGRLREDWKAQTRDNALFLSTSVQLNSYQLRPVFDWFKSRLNVMNADGKNPSRTLSWLDQKKNLSQRVESFLRGMDLSVDEIQVDRKPFDPQSLPPDMPHPLRERIIQDLTGEEVVNLRFLHPSSIDPAPTVGDRVAFSLEEQSAGTQNLFFFAGPWLDLLDNSGILVVDEIDTSLHPLIVRRLVEQLQCPSCRGQLIFTTHDSSLLSSGLFRRDQIWFVEKTPQWETELYPLSDFPVQKKEALEKRYLNGRYGAIPFFGDL